MMVHQGTVVWLTAAMALHTVADGGRLLGIEPDHEARAIHQVHHRQMEGFGEIDVAHHLLARLRRPRAAIVDRNRWPAAAPRGLPAARSPAIIEPAEIGAHLEERALVDNGVDDRAHLVDLTAVARHRFHQAIPRRAPDRRHTAASAAGHTPTTADKRESAGRRQRPPPRYRRHDRRRPRGSGYRRRPVPAWSDPGPGV